MGVNKVIYGGDTIVDLTGDSVSPSALLKGVSAHNSAGEVITGEFDPEELTQGFYKHLTKTSQHNLLKITAKSGTQNGISYTVDKAAGTVFIPEGQTYTASSYLDIVIGEVATFDRNEDVILSNMPMIENTGYFVLSSSSLADAIVTTDPYDKTIEAGERVTIKFRLVRDVETPSGGLLFKPMIRYSEDTDSTFAPHAESNLKLTRKVSDIYESNFGAGVNLFELDFVSQTIKGITVTLNKDKTVTINGTATEEINFNLAPFGTLGKRVSYNTDYILSGGASDKCIVATTDNTNASSVFVSDGGEQTANFASTIDLTMLTICVIIKSGYTANNLVLKPMLRKAEITDPTFYPYIKTNQALTEDVAVLPENAKKNWFDYNTMTDVIFPTGVMYANGVFNANGATDSRNYTALSLIEYDSSMHMLYNKGYKDTAPIGFNEMTYDKDSNCRYLKICHSGYSTDIGVMIDVGSLVSGTRYILSLNLTNNDPSSGSWSFKELMIRPAGTSPDFVPYMRSNLELTHDTDGVRGVGRNLIDVVAMMIYYKGRGYSDAWSFDRSTATLTISNENNIYSSSGDGRYRFLSSDIPVVLTFDVECTLNDGSYSDDTIGSVITLRDTNGNRAGDEGFVYCSQGFKHFELMGSASQIMFSYGSGNNCTIKNLQISLAKYADDPTYYPYSENEIEFQENMRQNAVKAVADLWGCDANTMDSNSIGFCYANNSPLTGPIIDFTPVRDNKYSLQLNTSYNSLTPLYFRTHNGDSVNDWTPWRRLALYSEVPAYEEGTWTPTINTVMSQAPFKTASLSPSTKCLYTVIGNTVILRVNIIIYLSKDDTSSIADTVPANIYIEGTPFKPSSTFNLNIMGTIGTTYYDIPCFTHTVVLKPQGILQFNIMQHPTISYTNGSTINFRGNIIYSK